MSASDGELDFAQQVGLPLLSVVQPGSGSPDLGNVVVRSGQSDVWVRIPYRTGDTPDNGAQLSLPEAFRVGIAAQRAIMEARTDG